MSAHAACPDCGERFSAAENRTGDYLTCPRCDISFVAPERPPADPSRKDSRPRVAREKRSVAKDMIRRARKQERCNVDYGSPWYLWLLGMSATVITVVTTVLINLSAGGHGPRLFILFVLGVMFLCFRIAQANHYRVMPRVIVLSTILAINVIPLCLIVGVGIYVATRPKPPPAPPPPPRLPPPKVPFSPAGLQGLVGYWSFDEGGGERAADGSGGGNHASLRGAGWTQGVRGKALLCKPGNTYCDYGGSPRFNFAARKQFSVAGWVKTTEAAGVVMSQRNSVDSAPLINVTVENGFLRVSVHHDADAQTDGSSVLSIHPINDDTWHHFVLIRSQTHQIEWFVDGESQGRVAATGAHWGTITTDMRAVGAECYWVKENNDRARNGTAYLKGAVDEFCIFDRELGIGEVKGLAGR